MNIYAIVALSICTQIAVKGSKMLVALHALELNAGPLAIGLLVAMYALFPMQLAIYAGRVCDRRGVRLPMAVGSVGVAAGLIMPILWSHIGALYVSAVVIGCSTLFYQVSAQYTVGAIAEGTGRTRDFSLYSLGGSISGFLGPLLVGYAMEGAGKLATYAVLAAIAIIPAVVLTLLRHRPLPRQKRADPGESTRVMRLLRNPGLRQAFMMSAVILTGLDLFNFYMPIYGRSLGLTPSSIGIVLSMQAAAAFVVRLFLPRLVGRVGEQIVLRGTLVIAAVSYFLFPLMHEVIALAAVAFLMGLALGCGQPLSMQLTQQFAPTGRVGEAIGLRLTFNRLTQIAVPVVFGSLGSFGVFAVFWANSALLLSGSFVTARAAPAR
ncbi:MAG: MFS transporter [Pseudomonadota bacterium]|nr:MFS transporter [Pseudomonadota bacterium]